MLKWLIKDHIDMIMDRNDTVGLYCRDFTGHTTGKVKYSINIRNIPLNGKESIYIFNPDGSECKKVSVDDIYIMIYRNYKDNSIMGFELFICPKEVIDSLEKMISSEVIPLRTFLELMADIYIIDKPTKDADDKSKYKLNVYTYNYIGNISSSEFTSNDDCILIESDEGRNKISVPKEYIWVYALYPMISSDQSCIICAKDFAELVQIVTKYDLYNNLHGEYIETESGAAVKAHSEVFINIKTKKVYNGAM